MKEKKKENVELVPHYWTWSPVSMFEDMERLFADLRSGFIFPGRAMVPKEGTRMPMLDLREENDRYVVQAEMPGMGKEDVSIEMEGDVLQITARKEHEVEEKDEGYLRRERGSMRFFRQVRLPENVDRDKVKAKMENGVLEIALPKMEVSEEKKSRIDVE